MSNWDGDGTKQSGLDGVRRRKWRRAIIVHYRSDEEKKKEIPGLDADATRNMVV
jgi:hypothetical protein